MNSIEKFQEIISEKQIKIEVLDESLGSLKSVQFSIGNRSWQIFIDDEYDYLQDNRLPMNFHLVLSELEIYQEDDDFLTWCKQNGSDLRSGDFQYLFEAE